MGHDGFFCRSIGLPDDSRLTWMFKFTSRPRLVIHARTSVVVDGPHGQGDEDEIFID